jgi:putative transposase
MDRRQSLQPPQQQAAASFPDKILADISFPVLSPRSPQMNGTVERCNGVWRYEFYETYDLASGVDQLNSIVERCQRLYTHHRPHGAPAGKTQAQHLANRSAMRRKPSHMS